MEGSERTSTKAANDSAEKPFRRKVVSCSIECAVSLSALTASASCKVLDVSVVRQQAKGLRTRANSLIETVCFSAMVNSSLSTGGTLVFRSSASSSSTSLPSSETSSSLR